MSHMTSKPKQRVLSESAIVQAVAERACRRCVHSIRRSLQGMSAELSGEDSGLHNVWEEICVQIQYEHSVVWDMYEQTLRALVEGAVEDMAQLEQEAIWLQTDSASDWECNDGKERDPYPVFKDDIIEYILNEHLLYEAGRWTNPRIRAYIDRLSLRD